MHYRFVALSLAVVSWSLAQACGGDDSNSGDASPDGTTSDTGTGNDSGTGNDTGTGNDSGGGGLQYRCGFGPDAGTVTDCAQCQGFPIECALCAVNDASVVEGRCGSLQGGCTVGGNTGFASCPCANGEAGTCPESYQVCRANGNNGFGCHTCGEPQTNGLTCENGGTCAIDAGCK